VLDQNKYALCEYKKRMKKNLIFFYFFKKNVASLINWLTNGLSGYPNIIFLGRRVMPIIETLMLIGGLIFFSGTVTYDLNKQVTECKNSKAISAETITVSSEQITEKK